MKKNHFIFGYDGNKREEVQDIYDFMDLNDIEYIIEPFCGSSAISFYISLLHPKKYKYILNDKNADLIKLYNIMADDVKYRKFIKSVNDKLDIILNEGAIDKQKIKYNEIIKEKSTVAYYIKYKIRNIRPGLFPIYKKITKIDENSNCPIIDFLRNEDVKFYNMDAIELIKKYDIKNKCCFILDPPYMFTCNSNYNHNEQGSVDNFNIYDYVASKSIKSLFYIVLDYLWMIKYIFPEDKFKYKKYKKKYNGPRKRETIHCVITNH